MASKGENSSAQAAWHPGISQTVRRKDALRVTRITCFDFIQFT